MTQNYTTPDCNAGGRFEPEVYDQNENSMTPTPHPKIDLRDAHAIRREMGTVYRDMRAGIILPQDGTRFVYVLAMICKSYETAVLQDRLALLELALKHRRE